MSNELGAIRKKRTPLNSMSSNSVSEGDHRKRRRNRTTQSCLNCHTSKRMCDRKRPCGRCTQLGLTGLCVYEVDDPSQRSNALDESSRLRRRVAELEGVVRELKNKPHPRWAKSGSNLAEEFEKCHTRARSRSSSGESMESQRQSNLSHPLMNSHADAKEASPEKQTCLVNESLLPDHLPSSFSSSHTASLVPLSTLPYSPYFDSPPSAPSTVIGTPAEEHPQMQITLAASQHLTNDIELASIFMSCPDLQACLEDTGPIDCVLPSDTHGQIVDCSMKCHHAQILDHCGCLNEVASYNVVLELSLRLRKAADILSRSANHRFNLGCPLNQKIVHLDAFTTTTLGNMVTSPNGFGPVHPRANAAPAASIIPAVSADSCISLIHTPAISPPSFHSLQSWGGISCTANPSAS